MHDTNKETKKPKILQESNQQSLFVDNLIISTRQDGMHLIQFYTSLPDGWSEQVRVMVSDLSLANMLHVLTEKCESWQADKENTKTSKH